MQSTTIDLIKCLVLNYVVTEYDDRHLKKSGEYKCQNISVVTTKIGLLIWIGRHNIDF